MKTKSIKLLAFCMVATMLVASVAILPKAHAAVITNTYIRLNTMKAGSTTGFRLVFKAASGGTNNVVIAFNGADSTTWTGSSGAVNTTQTASVSTCPTEASATALPGTLAAAGSSGTITISGTTALTAGTTYCVDLTSASAVTNATAGEYHPTITIGGDSTTVAVRTISNDAVTVNATVPPTFNFALSGNTDSFTSALSASSVVSTTGITATVNTNAKTGWTAWVKDSQSGLNSATQSKTIASVATGSTTTLATGVEKYGVGVTNIVQGSGVGNATPNAAFDATASSGVNSTVGGVDGTLRPLASSDGTAGNAILTIKERAIILGITPASADYTDTITLIAAGNF